mgnify:CR=1 FL=1
MGCRFCDNDNIIKSGKVRNKQRYHCKRQFWIREELIKDKERVEERRLSC